MQIKICGLKRMEDVDCVNQAEPDYAGFVFAGTKRRIDFDLARRLKEAMHPDIRTVGVFVNADIDFVKHLVEQRILDVVQLHGDENRIYIETLKKELTHIHCPVPIMKAVR